MQSQLSIDSVITKDVIKKIIDNPKSANRYCLLIHKKLGVAKNDCCAELLRHIDHTNSIKVKIRNNISTDFKNVSKREFGQRKGQGDAKRRTFVRRLRSLVKTFKKSLSDEDWQRALYESHIIRELEKEKNKDA